jgi:hypothetical protein
MSKRGFADTIRVFNASVASIVSGTVYSDVIEMSYFNVLKIYSGEYAITGAGTITSLSIQPQMLDFGSQTWVNFGTARTSFSPGINSGTTSNYCFDIWPFAPDTTQLPEFMRLALSASATTQTGAFIQIDYRLECQ